MQKDQLSPGDRAVELAALATSAAIVAGALSATAGARLAHRSWPVSFVAPVCGGLVGRVVGRVAGRALYRTRDGRTAIVRAGRAALPSACLAGLVGGLTSALVAAGLAVRLLAAPSRSAYVAAACCGLVVGLVLPCLASLS
jgi:hypothetical protein